jgi:class 3 adenylate cyclase
MISLVADDTSVWPPSAAEVIRADDLRVRIGIHSGEAVAVGDDYAGIAIAKASSA